MCMTWNAADSLITEPVAIVFADAGYRGQKNGTL